MEKRIYSLNLAAYVMATTNLLPQLVRDEESGTYYMLFPPCAGVAGAVREFKKYNPTLPIHDFLHAVKLLRASIKEREIIDKLVVKGF